MSRWLWCVHQGIECRSPAQWTRNLPLNNNSGWTNFTGIFKFKMIKKKFPSKVWWSATLTSAEWDQNRDRNVHWIFLTSYPISSFCPSDLQKVVLLSFPLLWQKWHWYSNQQGRCSIIVTLISYFQLPTQLFITLNQNKNARLALF